MPLTNAHLPVIDDPGLTPGTDPSSAYASGPQATAVFNDLDGIKYTFTTLTTALPAHAMFSGMISFVPAGTTYNPLAPGFTTVISEIASDSTSTGGALLKLAAPVDIALFPIIPSGVPLPVYILIDGVDPVTFRADLTPKLAAIPLAILDASWSETEASNPASETRPTKETKFMDRLMLGQKDLAVSGSDTLGVTQLNTNGNPEFDFRVYFTENISSSSTFSVTKVSPLGLFKKFPEFIDVDPNNASYISKWKDHPLITSVDAFEESTLKAYIKFEIWNPGYTSAADEYVPVDSGLTISMMEYDAIGSDSVILDAVTDGDGKASFTVPVPGDWLNTPPDIYFKILSPTASAATGLPTLPNNWSTKKSGISEKDWYSTSGAKGFYKNFEGHVFGSPNNPLVYRVGMDFHIKFQYIHTNPHYSQTLGSHVWSSPVPEQLPDDIKIELHNDIDNIYGLINPFHEELLSNGDGEVHGILFDLDPAKDLFWAAFHNIERAAIKLDAKTSKKEDSTEEFLQAWITSDPDTQFDNNGHSNFIGLDSFKDFRFPSMGSPTKPLIFKTLSLRENNRRASFYMLKIARELAFFFHNMTNGGYNGSNANYRFAFFPQPSPIDMTKAQQLANDATPYAWPVDRVNMTDLEFHWSRDTIAHESSHHVYWHAVDYGSLDIIKEILPGGELILLHWPSMVTNNEHALIEGFPEAIEIIFSGQYFDLTIPARTSRYLIDKDNNEVIPGSAPPATFKIGPDLANPINQGEIIEGVVANCLAEIFWELIVNPHFTGHGYRVNESDSGDVTSNNSWITNTSIRNGFNTIIWNPLQNLINTGNDPNSTDLLDLILSSNASIEHEIRGILNSYNCRVEAPTLTINSTPGPNNNSGSQTGGKVLTLTGTNFIKLYAAQNALGRSAYIKITFGTVPGVNLNILSSTSLEITTPPHSPGLVDINIELIIETKHNPTIAAIPVPIPGTSSLQFTYV